MNPLLPVDYLAVTAALLLAGGTFAAWRSAAGCRPGLRTVIAGARLLTLTGLVLIALNPGRWQTSREPAAATWAVLLDRSASMAVADAPGETAGAPPSTRWDAAARLAGQAAAAAEKNGAAVHLLPFAAELEDATALPAALHSVKPDGNGTRLAAAVQHALGRFPAAGARALAGILLVSDGRPTADGDVNEAALRARADGVPVHALVLGGPVPRRDLAVAVTRRQTVAFTGQTVRLTAEVRNAGLGAIRPEVALLDAAGNRLDVQRPGVEDGKTAEVTFTVTARAKGCQSYRIQAAPWPGERNTANNQEELSVVVLDTKLRVLLLEGSPHWDSKFLAQFLRRQAYVSLDSAARVTPERVFRVSAAAEPPAAASPAAVFPATAAELGAYDAVMFGKGADYFLTPDRVRMLREYVAERGGALFFTRGKAGSAPFPALEALEPVEWGDNAAAAYRLLPTPAGEDAGIFGSVLPGRAAGLWQQLSPLRPLNHVAALQPFTQVLAEGAATVPETKPATVPLLISRRFGRGVILTLNAEGLWKWDFLPEARERGNAYQDLWLQLLLWAGTHAEFLPGQEYALRLTEHAAPPETPVRVRVSRRMTAGSGRTDGTPAAPPRLRVSRGGTLVQRLTLTPAAENEGAAWNGFLTLTTPGSHRVEIESPDGDGLPETAQTLQILAPPGELDETSADPATLAHLTAAAGGRLLKPGELAEVIRPAPPPVADGMTGRAEWEPAWAGASWLLLLLAGFALEWFLRRRNGLH